MVQTRCVQPIFPACVGSGARLGLGGAPLGNLFSPVSDADARAVLGAAWAVGCRSFDTAPHYGHGLSERRFGDALARILGEPELRRAYGQRGREWIAREFSLDRVVRETRALIDGSGGD